MTSSTGTTPVVVSMFFIIEENLWHHTIITVAILVSRCPPLRRRSVNHHLQLYNSVRRRRPCPTTVLDITNRCGIRKLSFSFHFYKMLWRCIHLRCCHPPAAVAISFCSSRMEVDCTSSNREFGPLISANAVDEEVPVIDASEATATFSTAPGINHTTENRMSADSVAHDKGIGAASVETQGPGKNTSALKKGREAITIAASAISSSPCAAPPVSRTDNRIMYTYPELLKRCTDNKLYRAGPVVVFSLGCLTSPSVFHTRRYILPVGFTSVRSFTSFVQPDTQCPYICEILDSGDEKQALFRVTCIDDVEQPVVALSPSAAWRQVVRMIRAKAQHSGIVINFSDQISGLVMFGVVHPSIQQTLRGLAGSARCRSMEYFEHKTGYEDGADVDVIDASTYAPHPRLLADDSDENDLRPVVPVSNFLSELDQHVSDIIATTPLSRRAIDESVVFQPLPHGFSHDEVAHIISVVSSDGELSAAEAEVFEKLVAYVRSTSSHSPGILCSPSNGKHDVLCWWHMHEATCAAQGFSRLAICNTFFSVTTALHDFPLILFVSQKH